LLTPWPMKILIDSVLANTPSPLPAFLSPVVGGIAKGHWSLILIVVAGGLVLTIVQHTVSVFNSYIDTLLQNNIILDFRTDLFEHTERLSMAYHDRRRAGMMIYVINSQGDCVARLIMTVPQIGQSVLSLIGMFWIAFKMDWELALLCLTVVPFIYYSIGYYAKHIKSKLFEVRGMEAESLSIVHEAINMLRVIVAF